MKFIWDLHQNKSFSSKTKLSNSKHPLNNYEWTYIKKQKSVLTSCIAFLFAVVSDLQATTID